MAHINIANTVNPKQEIGIWVYGCGDEALVKMAIQNGTRTEYLSAARMNKENLVTQMREVLYDLGWTCIEHKVVE